VRWRGYLEFILSRYTKKPIDRDIRHLLWITLYQVGFMKKAHYHVVKESVEYAKTEKGKYVAGFVNAVLRRSIRDTQVFDLPEKKKVEHSFPTWLKKRWIGRFGAEKALELMAHLNKEPRFSLRVDMRKIPPSEARRELLSEDITSENGQYAPSALTVEHLSGVTSSKIFRAGLVSIQGESSQLAGFAIKEIAGNTVLDACAGSGTKSRQIMELCPDSRVFSMDKDLARLKLSKLEKNVICADALLYPFKACRFDTILVDAPCSSLGIISKHPEIKWRRQETDIAEFAKIQLSLLEAAIDLLPPGGRIIYSVCSFEPEETVDVIHNLAKAKKITLENPLPFLFNKEYFISLPHETAMDGFFIARIKKL
jgi:16S rRNA (cytosine967-C5)-methyltransferase